MKKEKSVKDAIKERKNYLEEYLNNDKRLELEMCFQEKVRNMKCMLK